MLNFFAEKPLAALALMKSLILNVQPYRPSYLMTSFIDLSTPQAQHMYIPNPKATKNSNKKHDTQDWLHLQQEVLEETSFEAFAGVWSEDFSS